MASFMASDIVSVSSSQGSLELGWLPCVLQQQGLQGLLTLCSMLQSSRSVCNAILAHCCGSVALEGRPGTTESVDHLAAWVAKYGSLLASLHLQLDLLGAFTSSPVDPAVRGAALAGLASALQHAAALPQGLQLRSCKLVGVHWDGTAILQQLPVNRLTSLTMELELTGSDHHHHVTHSSLTGSDDVNSCAVRLAGVTAALPQLQQLRALSLYVPGNWTDRDSGVTHLRHVDPLLHSLSGLTYLTSLKVGVLFSRGPLQHLPASLLELCYEWYETLPDPLQLRHLTALAKLTTGDAEEIRMDAELPASLRELQCGRFFNADVLLQLGCLQRLTVQGCLCTAAELARLSSITALTHISLTYDTSLSVKEEAYDSYVAENQLTPETASQAWGVLASQLRQLHIIADNSRYERPRLSAPAVAAIGSLSAVTSLVLMDVDCSGVQPEQLAAALQRCTALQVLELGRLALQWGQVDEAGDGAVGDGQLVAAQHAVEARGIEVVAAALACLQTLSLSNLPISMHAAAKLAAAAARTQLTQLTLMYCRMTDCSMNALALGLTNLRSLCVEGCDVGDAVLPALAKLPLQWMGLYNCRCTDAALDLFIPCWRKLRAEEM